ncbi:MAG: hypothetical protein IH602_11365 [Bryobacteraceae bacterium]|nr:hypothetical protein [Bryobacteraceae bacterium]
MRLPWNWKTALSSGIYRSPAFLLAGFSHAGTAAGVRAASIEFAVLAAAAGFTGAWLESLNAKPRGLYTRAVVFCFVPAALHLAEFVVHSLAGTPAAGRGIMLSIGLSIVSSSFCWHTMRRGAMLTSAGAPGLLDDLRRMPQLLLSFVTSSFSRSRVFIPSTRENDPG